MATLIAVYNSEGCVGRCDARCYDATGPECDCICRGANHGAGLKRAQDNTRELADRWMTDCQQAHRGSKLHFDLPEAAMQGRLF